MGLRTFVRALAVAGAAAALLASWSPAHADEGWSITSFVSDIAVATDSTLTVQETIAVDFAGLSRHGIFRDIPVVYAYDSAHDRVYDLTVKAVDDGSGHPWPYSVSRQGIDVEIKIGDPNRTVSGRQTYRINYRVLGVMTALPDRDRLLWNVDGHQWPVPTGRLEATVHLPAPALAAADCFQGTPGSTAPCTHQDAPAEVHYSSRGALASGEEVTIQADLRKGAISVPPPRLASHERSLGDAFDDGPAQVAAALVVLLAGLIGLAYNWWAHGRDRQYRTNHYLTNDPAEEIEPLFGHRAVTVEFEPPDRLRAAQMGVVLDQRPDTKDVTACIVDLAVRGYLSIAEIPKHGLLGHRDWRLDRRRAADAALLPFEATVMNGLFAGGDTVLLSDLKNRFYTSLNQAEEQLTEDAMARRWFRMRPGRMRILWGMAGVLLVAAGVGEVVLIGRATGFGLVGAALAVVGIATLASIPFVSTRTATGSEMLRRVLGFRMYLNTAERYQQQLAEREGIFSAYLPYAIVFGCVHRWADAFKGLDIQPSAATWYYGPGPFNALVFSSSLQSFSGSLGTAIQSSPSSGGGGSFSGGGGGGGGGGSW